MSEYNGTIELISGITPKNGGTFPLVRDKDVLLANGARLSDLNINGVKPDASGNVSVSGGEDVSGEIGMKYIEGSSAEPIVFENLATGVYYMRGYYQFMYTSSKISTIEPTILICNDRKSDLGIVECSMISTKAIRSLTIQNGAYKIQYQMSLQGKTDDIAKSISDGSDLAKLYTTAKAVYNATMSPERFFNITAGGEISLKPEYRGCPTPIGDSMINVAISAEERELIHANGYSDNDAGINGSRNNELPEVVVIPDQIGETTVTSLAPGMFWHNHRVKEITIPSTVKAIPHWCCSNAKNLKEIHNISQVTSLGAFIVRDTLIENMQFPNLASISPGTFAENKQLSIVDIGNVTQITFRAFYNCRALGIVKGGNSVTTIGQEGFNNTLNLKTLPFLSKVTSIGNRAFHHSRIQFDWDSLDGKCTFGTQAYPTQDNTVKYWEGVKIKPCENRIVTKLNQSDPEWKSAKFGDTDITHNESCTIFSVMHIHSALSGNQYNHPDEFADELRTINPALATNEYHPYYGFEKANALLQALGYDTEVFYDTTTSGNYQKLCDALAQGAYIYSRISTPGNDNEGHAVITYGMCGNGEALVLDSSAGNGTLIYRMTYQNLTGPGSDFIIVRRKADE